MNFEFVRGDGAIEWLVINGDKFLDIGCLNQLRNIFESHLQADLGSVLTLKLSSFSACISVLNSRRLRF